MTAASPCLTPEATNWVPNTVLPEPAGPATSTASPEGMPPPISTSRPGTPEETRTREDLDAVAGDAEGVQTRHCSLPAHLDYLQLAHDGVAVDALEEPEDAVG